MTDTTKTYSNRSNAARAAKAAGMLPGKFEVYEEGPGRWCFRLLVQQDATVEAAAPATAPADAAAPAADGAVVAVAPAAKVKAPKAPKAPKADTTGDDAAKAQSFPKPGSKNRILIDLVCRPTGATMAEMTTATGWKKCGGTLGTLDRQFGLQVRREKVDGVSRWFGVLPAEVA